MMMKPGKKLGRQDFTSMKTIHLYILVAAAVCSLSSCAVDPYWAMGFPPPPPVHPVPGYVLAPPSALPRVPPVLAPPPRSGVDRFHIPAGLDLGRFAGVVPPPLPPPPAPRLTPDALRLAPIRLPEGTALLGR